MAVCICLPFSITAVELLEPVGLCKLHETNEHAQRNRGTHDVCCFSSSPVIAKKRACKESSGTLVRWLLATEIFVYFLFSPNWCPHHLEPDQQHHRLFKISTIPPPKKPKPYPSWYTKCQKQIIFGFWVALITTNDMYVGRAAGHGPWGRPIMLPCGHTRW